MLLFLLIVSAVLLILPAVLCCLAGGWLLLFGVLALFCWLQLGWWVAEEAVRYLRRQPDEYI